MTCITEFESQRAYLGAAVGLPGSGAVRYAAAMYFYNEDKMPPAMLEIYRRCSKFDAEDPVNLARFEGIKVPPVCFPDAQIECA